MGEERGLEGDLAFNSPGGRTDICTNISRLHSAK
jgi:hypothetical protein